MRYIVAGSSHYTDSVLSAIRRADPTGIIYFVERSSEVSETIAKRFNARAVHGNLADISTYRRAEIDKADVFIAISESDALNLRLARMACEVYRVPKCVVYLNNPLNLENVPEGYNISPITLQRYFDFELELRLSSDVWIEAPLPEELGLKTYIYRFGRFSYGDLTIKKVRESVRDIDVALLFFNSSWARIENENKVLSGGDYLVLSGERASAERARSRIDEQIRKRLVGTLSDVGTAPFGTVR